MNPRLPPRLTSTPERADAPDAEALALALAREKVDAVVRLAGGVAHDFNNLLTVIGGNSEHLLEVFGPDTPYGAEITEIAEAARRAATLTHQLLAFSRQLVLQPQIVDPREILETRWDSLRTIAGDEVTLRRHVRDVLGRVLVDPQLFEQALAHLVRNAVDAVGGGGTVQVTLEDAAVDEGFAAQHEPMTPGSYVLLTVSDDGVGMDAATLARAFEPFFTTKGQKHGTGMGLPTVYGIVKQSGGYIWMDSAPGQGTRCQIYLPHAAPVTGSLRGAPPARAGALAGHKTVLVVEDEDLLRILARRTLERAGYRVVEAPNAQQALELVRGQGLQPDLLLSDIVMPGMNGRELAATLEKEFPRLSVVLMSGFVDQREQRTSIGGDRWQFLPKPFSLDALRGAIRRSIG